MATRQTQQASNYKLFSYLDDGSLAVLEALVPTDVDFDQLPWDYNAVWLALKGLTSADPTPQEYDLGRRLEPLVWNGTRPNKSAIARAYALCQTHALNQNRGAIGTGELGTIRQRWYFSKDAQAMGFKFFAQAFENYLVASADVVLVDDAKAWDRARELGAQRIAYKNQWSDEDQAALEEELGREVRSHIWPRSGWGIAYAGLQSKVLADLVRDGLTYDELWVRDASRDVDRNQPLLPNFYGAICLEKQGLFEHFQSFSRAAGVPVLLAMSGVNAFSSVESILNDNFRTWEGEYKPTFENPLHLFVISDHDYSGMVPIQEGAAEQFRRYLPGAVRVHRVGITPGQVVEAGRTFESAGYEYNYDRNKATREWADECGLWVGDVCYALEVEALAPSAFVEQLVDEIVDAVGGDEALRKRLLEAAEPDWDVVSADAMEEARKQSQVLTILHALTEWAESQSYDRRYPIDQTVTEIVESDDFQESDEVDAIVRQVTEDQAENVDIDEYKSHVKRGGWGAYSPVSAREANDKVVTYLLDRFADPIADSAQMVDAKDRLLTALESVVDILGEFDLEV